MHKIIHKKLIGLSAGLCLSLSLVVDPAAAQSSSQGNTTIFAGTQMTVFGTHTFLAGGAGIQPGIINAERAVSPGILGFGPGASYTGQDDANHVNGYVSKNGTSAFVFPVGNGTKLRTIAISAPASSGVYKAAYFSGSPSSATLPAGAPFPVTNLASSGVTGVSQVEYWDLDGPGPVDVTLTWDAASGANALATSNIVNLIVVGYNTSTSKWEALGNAGGTTGTLATTGTITATGVTPDNYSAFALGANSALPVTLVAFDVRKEGSTSLLGWSTTAETNSDRFEIERSANGKAWSKIGTVASTGESKVLVKYTFSDANPLSGENYYRLKMVDKDATFAYSSIKNVSFGHLAKQLAYPNPARDIVYIQDADNVKSVSVIDMNGKTVKEAGIAAGGTFRVDGLAVGMYLVKVVDNNGGVKSQKIMIAR
ncbi:Por secretion system C-terminal sorting domain-containing protein [Dyadobacter soli]|uniref:Por secretion system C-terminal sorting domain-containing protein n=1 Tax=Dyadobacter soli TaxID=659014 RepID=A0A1G7EBI6_9BACT|nr:T9SS type A sorting domain-containing protein [Dyadobacter soli]SDE61007.1 Por secretion system C-terminal sorting domain-containing protein [Dyadobacter soli]